MATNTGKKLRPRDDPTRRALRVSEWPVEDQAAWQRAIAPGDILDDPSAAAGWAPVTQRKVALGYGRYLGWLGREGRLDPRASARELLRPELVRAYLAALLEINAPWSVVTRAGELRQFFRAVLPEHDITWLVRLEARLRGDAVPVKNKRQRLQPAAVLVALGEELMRQAQGEELPGWQRLTAYRDGLMLSLLALRPLRLKNLTQLTVGGSLRRVGGAGWQIVLEAEETKNRRPLELPFPDLLVPALEHYLAEVRPALLVCRSRWYRDPGAALWISNHGSPITKAAVHQQITRRTAAAFGQALNPHLFRDCAATSLALVSPEAVRAGGLVLGHTDYATTQRHYNLARAVDAAERYHTVLDGLRRRKKR